jgi:hypothetical protein
VYVNNWTGRVVCVLEPRSGSMSIPTDTGYRVKKRVYFRIHRSRVSVHASHETLTLHSPWLILLARCECLKRHGVGEREGGLGTDFSSVIWSEDLIVSIWGGYATLSVPQAWRPMVTWPGLTDTPTVTVLLCCQEKDI